MIIYFCGSIRGGRQLASTYEKLIGMLEGYGKVLTEHLGSNEMIGKKDRVLTDKEIHDRDLDWVRESDVVVADVTVPSLGVGYEIGRAIEIGKPVLCLFNTSSKFTLSAMIAGSDEVVNHSYKKPEELGSILDQFFTANAPDRTS